MRRQCRQFQCVWQLISIQSPGLVGPSLKFSNEILSELVLEIVICLLRKSETETILTCSMKLIPGEAEEQMYG